MAIDSRFDPPDWGSRNKVLTLLEELCKLNRGTLPEELLDQIKAWGSYYGDAAVETLTLIEFRDQTTFIELLDRSDVQAQENTLF